MTSIQHPNQDVRNASGKILLDVHKLSGCVTAEELEVLNEKARNVLQTKLKAVKIEKNLMDEADSKANQNALSKKIFEEDGDITESAEINQAIGVGDSTSPSKVGGETRIQMIQEKKKIVEERGTSKDW